MKPRKPATTPTLAEAASLTHWVWAAVPYAVSLQSSTVFEAPTRPAMPMSEKIT